MKSTTRAHVNDVDLSAPNVVYIGRAVPRRGLKRSLWANQFTVKDWGREQAITKYQEHLIGNLDGLNRLDRLEELRGKTLACWCKPGEACHADVLIALLGSDA